MATTMPPRPKATPIVKKAVPARQAAPAKAASPAKAAAVKKSAPVVTEAPTKRAATSKEVTAVPTKASAPKKRETSAAPVAKAAAAKKAPPTKAAAPVKSTAPAKRAAAQPVVATAVAPPAAKKAAPAKKVAPARPSATYVADQKFLDHQRELLLGERATYLQQSELLKAEAESLVEEMEPGDIQFDEESGEGGTLTVDRERDLVLSAQAQLAVEDIDDALRKITRGRYGICEGCGDLISKPRLEAMPFARLCIACKSGGLSRR
jgi:RNA polymerase-binding transcription factor DksA